MARQSADAPFVLETLVPDGLRYVLPDREQGQTVRNIGLIMCICGLGLFVLTVYGLYQAAIQITSANGVNWNQVAKFVVRMPFCLVAIAIYGTGRLGLNGKGCVTLQGGTLTYREETRLFHWSWRRNAREIASFAAYEVPIMGDPKTGKDDARARFAFIHGYSNDPRPMVLAGGYPYAT